MAQRPRRTIRADERPAMSEWRLAGVLVVCLLGPGCLSAPRLTDEAVRRQANARAVVKGVVQDEDGRPVAGIQVIGLPRERDLPWSEPATTDASGRFRLPLVAPGEYGFLLSWQGITLITGRSDDPSRLRETLAPGTARDGLVLTWRRAEWESLLEESGQKLPARD